MEVQALNQQEKTLNEQIVKMKKEVAKTTPDEDKLKELDSTVERYQKGK